MLEFVQNARKFLWGGTTLICASGSRSPADETNEETELTTTQLLVGGQWAAVRSGATEEVRSPFDGSVVGEVSTAGVADVELALAAAERGAAIWRRTPDPAARRRPLIFIWVLVGCTSRWLGCW